MLLPDPSYGLHDGLALASVPGVPSNSPPFAQVRRLDGIVHHLDQVVSPERRLERCALKGVQLATGTFDNADPDNTLFAVDARDSVITTLYDPIARKGVVLHLDRSGDVDQKLRDALAFLDVGVAPHNRILANLVGGVWLGAGPCVGDDIARQLRSVLIDLTWDDWSFSSCYEHRYGVALDLAQGRLTVFEHTAAVAATFEAEMWRQHAMQATPQADLSPPVLAPSATLRYAPTFPNLSVPLSDRQMQTLEGVTHSLIQNADRGVRSHTRRAFLTHFSSDMQAHLRAELSPRSLGLYAAPLPDWEKGVQDGVRRRASESAWHLVYERADDGITVFGIFNTRQVPYTPWQ